MSLRQQLSQIVSFSALVLAGLAFSSAAYMIVTGGFDLRLYGIPLISAHNSRRALLIGVVASALYLVIATPESRQRVRNRLAALARPVMAIPLLAATVALTGWSFANTVIGGSDSYGYVSQVDLWLRGELKVAQPWVEALPWPSPEWSASPLGYRPDDVSPLGTLVPTYSPGFPLLMAIARGIAGHCAMFLVVPFCGSLMIAATYAIGHRLNMPIVGLLAAGLVATSPVFLFYLMVPMSDLPAGAFWTLAFYLALGATPRSALLAGICCGISVLIRPNLLFLAGVIAIRYAFASTAGHAVSVRQRAALATAFVAGIIPSVIAIAAIYNYLYGSPLTSGYGQTADLFAAANLAPNATRYLSWFADTHTHVALAGPLALFVRSRHVWPRVSDRRVPPVMGLLVVATWLHYCAYMPFDGWLALRFLLPSWPFMMFGFAALLMASSRFLFRKLPEVCALVLIALCTYNLAESRSLGVFDTWWVDREPVAVDKAVGSGTSEHSVFLTMQHSGSLRYYGGRLTLRYDQVDPQWLDRAVSWFVGRGVTPYALLEEYEVPQFRRRFEGQNAVGRLDVPLWVFHRTPSVYLYDLSRRPQPTQDRTSDLTKVRRCEKPGRLAVPPGLSR